MIRINLLPEEYRRSNRTSPKVFAAVLVAVMVVCGTFGWFGYVYFGELGVLQVSRVEHQERLIARKERVGYYDSLVTEKNDYEQRSKTIAQIAQSRVLWTEVLDQFIDVVNNDGDTERHMSWFNQLTVKDGNAKSGPQIQMPGAVQGDDMGRLADFHDDLEQAPFYKWVQSKGLPSATKATDPKKKPAESLTFQLQWNFVPPKDWKVER